MLLRAILCGRVWDGFLLGQAKTEEVPCRFCGGNGHSFWEWFQGRDAVRVEPPQPGVIHVHSAELGKPRVGPTQEPSPSCIWSRLPCAPEATQAVTKPWTLMRLCKRVLVVSVTVFGGDAPSVPRLHHKSSRFSPCLVKLGDQVLRDGCGEGGDTEGSAGTTMVATKGRHMMRLATKAGRAVPRAGRPPQEKPLCARHEHTSSFGESRFSQLTSTRLLLCT